MCYTQHIHLFHTHLFHIHNAHPHPHPHSQPHPHPKCTSTSTSTSTHPQASETVSNRNATLDKLEAKNLAENEPQDDATAALKAALEAQANVRRLHDDLATTAVHPALQRDANKSKLAPHVTKQIENAAAAVKRAKASLDRANRSLAHFDENVAPGVPEMLALMSTTSEAKAVADVAADDIEALGLGLQETVLV